MESSVAQNDTKRLNKYHIDYGLCVGVGTDSVLISHLYLHWVVGRRLTWYMGHVECRLIHACSFFFLFHDSTACLHGLCCLCDCEMIICMCT